MSLMQKLYQSPRSYTGKKSRHTVGVQCAAGTCIIRTMAPIHVILSSFDSAC